MCYECHLIPTPLRDKAEPLTVLVSWCVGSPPPDKNSATWSADTTTCDPTSSRSRSVHSKQQKMVAQAGCVAMPRTNDRVASRECSRLATSPPRVCLALAARGRGVGDYDCQGNGCRMPLVHSPLSVPQMTHFLSRSDIRVASLSGRLAALRLVDSASRRTRCNIAWATRPSGSVSCK